MALYHGVGTPRPDVMVIKHSTDACGFRAGEVCRQAGKQASTRDASRCALLDRISGGCSRCILLSRSCRSLPRTEASPPEEGSCCLYPSIDLSCATSPVTAQSQRIPSSMSSLLDRSAWNWWVCCLLASPGETAHHMLRSRVRRPPAWRPRRRSSRPLSLSLSLSLSFLRMAAGYRFAEQFREAPVFGDYFSRSSAQPGRSRKEAFHTYTHTYTYTYTYIHIHACDISFSTPTSISCGVFHALLLVPK